MEKLFDIYNLSKYSEGVFREIKSANAGLPKSVWETYSAFANTYGGVIILGVTEDKNGKWKTSGLTTQDANNLIKSFWDTVNNKSKVSQNILSDKDVQTYLFDNNSVVVINVPPARRNNKPVYINNDYIYGVYRRNGEGDYHCSKQEIYAMLRDSAEDTLDSKPIENMTIDDLDKKTIQSYRNYFKDTRPGHIFSKKEDREFLTLIGAATKSDSQSILCPTAAGLLMFGYEYDIVREFPEYFLDYREVLDKNIRWTDRIVSSSGDWSGNLFDFFFNVYNKIVRDFKIPFNLVKSVRKDDTAVHDAIREALVNCLVNADYNLPRSVVVIKNVDSIIFENPGNIRTGKTQMIRGGISDPRNKILLKMFNMIGFGERAGSGVPNIFDVWKQYEWETPKIIESFNPDRTELILSMKPESRRSSKIGEVQKSAKFKNRRSSKIGEVQKSHSKTQEHEKLIKEYLRNNKEASTLELANILGLKTSRTREILSNMENIKAIGNTNNRKYTLK